MPEGPEPGQGDRGDQEDDGGAPVLIRNSQPGGLDEEGRRLLWRCRRGMKELDVLLERFARSILSTASAEQRITFARFLELPDPVLVDYLLGQGVPPEPELAALVRHIIEPTPAR